jgi:hypothetical protein
MHVRFFIWFRRGNNLFMGPGNFICMLLGAWQSGACYNKNERRSCLLVQPS